MDLDAGQGPRPAGQAHERDLAVEGAGTVPGQGLLRGWRSVLFAPVGMASGGGAAVMGRGWPAAEHPLADHGGYQAGSVGIGLVLVLVLVLVLAARRSEVARDLGLSAAAGAVVRGILTVAGQRRRQARRGW